MELNLAKEVAALQRMTVTQLREKYADTFGEATATGTRTWLVRRIAWQLQARAEGDPTGAGRTANESPARRWAGVPGPPPGTADVPARFRRPPPVAGAATGRTAHSPGIAASRRIVGAAHIATAVMAPAIRASRTDAPIGPAAKPTRPAAVPASAVTTAATRERTVAVPITLATAHPRAAWASTGAAVRAAH